jgi:hypothetical protein
MSDTYFQVYEYQEDEPENKRRIYTFDNAMAAYDMVEFILNHDMFKPNIGVEEYEAPTKL